MEGVFCYMNLHKCGWGEEIIKVAECICPFHKTKSTDNADMFEGENKPNNNVISYKKITLEQQFFFFVLLVSVAELQIRSVEVLSLNAEIATWTSTYTFLGSNFFIFI